MAELVSKTRRLKIFLGGTCNGTNWRDQLKPKLIIDHFDPIVPDWTDDAQIKEIREREDCDFVVYTLTPHMTGFYSVAEVVDDSNKRPEKTVLCILYRDVFEGHSIVFEDSAKRSVDMIADMVRSNKATVCTSLDALAEYLNNQAELQQM